MIENQLMMHCHLMARLTWSFLEAVLSLWSTSQKLLRVVCPYWVILKVYVMSISITMLTLKKPLILVCVCLSVCLSVCLFVYLLCICLYTCICVCVLHMYVNTIYVYVCICRVEGSSVNLKNRFAGYNIELVVKQNSTNEVMAVIAERLPGVTTLYTAYKLLCGVVCRGSFEAWANTNWRCCCISVQSPTR